MAKKDHDDNAADQILKDLEQIEMAHGGGEKHVKVDGPPITVRISDDHFKAYVKVLAPMDTGSDTTKADVIEELKKNNVVHGIDDKAVDEIFDFGTYGVEVVVARGTAPSEGQPGRMEYKFEVDPEKKKVVLKVDEQGNVDHRQMGMVTSVEEGTLLAVKIPAVPGEEGIDILGNKIPVKQGKDIALPLGENTKATDDGLGIVATLSGQPILRDGKVGVSPVFQINGDVSYKTGNVDFNGTVVITGNVQSDFIVKATGNIEIHGNIDKAMIEAKGDVKVRGGMYGAQTGKITAAGSVWIRSIDSGIIEAGHNIIIGQQARMSVLMAGEDIILGNMKGSIVGGKATAAREFDVTNLGSPSFTETLIEVGLNPRLKKVHDELETKIKTEKEQLDKITVHIKTIRENEKKHGQMSDKERELMKKIVPAYHTLKGSLETDTAKLKYLDDKLATMTKGKARVRGTTFPGVVIKTLNTHMPIRKEINFSSFYEQNEQIIVGPYS